MRKNINIPADVWAKVEEVRFAGRFPSETATVVALLDQAAKAWLEQHEKAQA